MSNEFKFFWSIFLSLLMTNIPHALAADGGNTQQMIATETVVEELNREQLQQKVRDFVAREDVQNELMKNGVTKQEAELRLAGLSDFELKQLANQMDQAQAGGNVAGILVVVVLVLLIIFLAKRV